VFTFGVAAHEIPADFHDKPFNPLTTVQTAEIGTPFSTRQLTQMLKEKSGASRADVDLGTLTFSFSFLGNGSTLIGGPPWTILSEDGAGNPDLPVAAEALTNAEGFVRIDNEPAARQSNRYRAVRAATGLVWRQFMVRAFDRAVASGAVLLYARPQSASGDFRRLPADVWPLLEVADWQNGVAVAPDSSVYRSIHAQPYTGHWKSPGGKRGRKEKMDWDGVVKPKVFELLDHHGWPDPSDSEWSCQADVEAQVSAICGEQASESTVRVYTARFMALFQLMHLEQSSP
jgi:hypothetical protein